MADLIGKLNVLVQSSVHSVLGDVSTRGKQRDRQVSLSRLGHDIDKEISALRQEIDQALIVEDRLKADLQGMQHQIAEWDRQADEALARGDEATARYAIRQMQLQQQRATMTEAELAQHRRSAAELITRVNELEAVVAEARQQAAGTPESEVDDDEPLSARLRKARQRATQEMDALRSQDAPPQTSDESAVETDLAQRRARLSQKDG